VRLLPCARHDGGNRRNIRAGKDRAMTNEERTISLLAWFTIIIIFLALLKKFFIF
jgi:hypothetical protein